MSADTFHALRAFLGSAAIGAALVAVAIFLAGLIRADDYDHWED